MPSKKLPIVAIIGRANVGKSSLFNTVLSRREAIVAQEAGTTRDSVTAKASWHTQDFWLVDTAGVKDPEDDFELTIQEQIQQAVESADILWVMVEATIPITDEDRRVARTALKSRKPVYLIVNKIDQVSRTEEILGDFQRLGIQTIIATSTTQRRGIHELLDGLVQTIPKMRLPDATDRLHIALLGRPNVGKSYLFNTLAKKQQAIVADRAGTTRDINRSVVRFKGRELEIMDTAGIRRSGRIERGVEHFSVLRSLSAIEQADVCCLLMDANELNVQLDQKIAGLVKDSGKGLIIIVSKWDSIEEKTTQTRDQLARQIAAAFDFVPWAPLIFTSAVTGQNVAQIFELVLNIDEQRAKRISTAELNSWLREVVSRHPPAGLKNRAPKLNYIVQEDDNPTPAFKIFGSHTKFLHWSYRRYLERCLREAYGFAGTSVQLWFIEKHETHRHGHSPTKE
ncbi:MAG TPA: ribosome biogenesis GTPase Der [Candidatus Saccharimonadales bacterium]|nr:ribosome biogenesis GTPase Der [Candidatus Saccharimonadales bacterium]